MVKKILNNDLVKLDNLTNLNNNELDNHLSKSVSENVDIDEASVLNYQNANDLLKKNKYSEAKELLKLILDKYPKYSPALNLLGVISSSEKNLNEALYYFEKSLEYNPNYLNTLVNLGALYFNNKNFERSVFYYEKALNDRNEKNFPNIEEYFRVNKFLMRSYCNIYQYKKSYMTGIALEERGLFNTAILNLIGYSFLELDDYDNASIYYKKSIDIDPNNPIAYTNLGTIKSLIGETKEANKFFTQALRLDKNSVHSFKGLTDNSPEIISKETVEDMIALFSLYLKDSNEFLALLNILKSQDNSDTNFIFHELGYGLFNYFHYKKEYSKAYYYLEQVNRSCYLDKTGFNDFSQDQDNLNIIMESFLEINSKVFNNSYYNRFDAYNSGKDRLIFIIGMPRSGTTLVEQILSNHSKVIGLGERNEMATILTAILRKRGIEVNQFKKKDNLINKEELNKNLISVFESLSTAEITDCRKIYLDSIKDYSDNDFYFIDKMPSNFARLGLIRVLFPDSIFIHTKRDAIDTCFSNFSTLFAESQEYSYNQSHLVHYFKQYQEIMNYWEKKDFLKFTDVSYENIVKDIEGETRKLLSFINLEYEKDCVEFYKNKKAVRTASYAQVRKKIYKSSIKKWEPYQEYISILINGLTK